MTLSISISPEHEARLRELAEHAGKAPVDYAAQLLQAALTRPSLEELLEPLRREFRESGMDDADLIKDITSAQQAFRASRG